VNWTEQKFVLAGERYWCGGIVMFDQTSGLGWVVLGSVFSFWLVGATNQTKIQFLIYIKPAKNNPKSPIWW